jgi:5-hydroxyisourate hydrolase-like protein (transthyretin family)
MKRFVLLLFLLAVNATAAPRDKQWKLAGKLLSGDTPQSAGKVLEQIEAAARAEQAWPEAVKALSVRLQVEAMIQQDEPAQKLTRMDDALAKAPPEMQSMLLAVQATFHHHYFAEHRWDLLNRTKTTGEAGDDITAWDLPRVLAAVDERFQKALANAAALKDSPIAQWNGLLDAGDLPDSYQPTLFDFIARQALEHYTDAAQAAAETQAENAFEFAPDSPALGSMTEFLEWKVNGTQPKQRVVQTYQALLAFHKDDADAGARVLLDIERLEWAAATATGIGADERMLAQLRAIIAENAAHEVSLRARAAVAEALIKAKKPAEARALLAEGAAAHSKSPFAPRCRNLIKQIEQKSLSAATELIWNSAGPEIVVTAANMERLYFRLILVSKTPDPALLSTIMDDEEKIVRTLRKKPAHDWAINLPPATDFLEHEHRMPAPAGIEPGFYLLAVSGNADFTKRRNQISFAPVIVSPLALVSRARDDGDNVVIDAWVLDAVTGDPVPGAEVSVWVENEKTEKLTAAQTVLTDANGQAQLTGEYDDGMLLAKHDKHFAMTEDVSAQSEYKDTVKATTFLFTDRAIYRPGQTIQFKGIHARCDTAKNDYRTLANVKRTVVLKDGNDRELAKLDVVTNAFGSFSGSFTAPANGLTGRVTIADGTDRAWVRVEEYKRPKFKVEVLPPAVAPKLGETVTVKVQAVGYTGAPVDGAKVVWRVKREPEWAPWVRRAWWFHGSSDEKEIAHGEVMTAADGTAEVKFTAAPDKNVDEKTDPWFHFSIHADVTDTAGETRSADGSVRVGYTAMKAAVNADEWQTVTRPVALTVTTTTLDDVPLPAAGRLTVHRLVPPEKVQRPWLDDEHDDENAKDLSDPDTWESGEAVQRDEVKTSEKGEGTASVKLAAGAYRAVFETKDRFGQKVTAQTLVLVVDPAAEKFPVKVPFWAGAPSLELQPGDELHALWGSGYDKARAFIEIEHRGKIVQRFWSEAARTQQGAKFKVTEDHRGGFSFHITQMRENRLIARSYTVSVPWKNKDLSLKWEHLTSKLEPGAKEKWTVSIAGPAQEKLAAEMAAVLYDASLDALDEHDWPAGLDCFRHERSYFNTRFYNEMMDFEEVVDNWGYQSEGENSSLRRWPFYGPGRGVGFAAKFLGLSSGRVTRGLRFGSDSVSRDAIDALASGGAPLAAPMAAMEAGTDSAPDAKSAPADPFASKDSRPPPPETRPITARKNMQETAFFFPHLLAAEDGTVKLEFTMPEAVTTWRFFGFAHDTKLRSGGLTAEVITSKDLMVQPNPPRFLREGDAVEFTVKITNQSATPQHGTARLTFSDAATLAPADATLGLTAPEQPFEVPAKESRTVSWRITVPDGQGFLTWKATAGTDKMSDGEEGWLPVLSRRVLITESLPLSISKAGEKSYTFQKLAESAGSETLRHQGMTVQMVSQPAWYAVMALPYLMEFPHECSEQTFNRFYANALARHIAQSDPKIRGTFDLWRDAQPEALESLLLKNQELKSLLIEETPWLRDEAKESEQRRNLGVLFDANRLDSESARVLTALDGIQRDDGSWPWFPGGGGNEFITLYVVAGFGKLQHLGVEVKTDMAVEALSWLDQWLAREHKAAKKDGKREDHFGSNIALYLYARSFFLEQRPLPEEQKPALDFFLTQARKHWPGKGRMTQAHAALGLLRFGDQPTAAKILASLEERSVFKEEVGRYWADNADAWRWDAAPVESQALMIEAFRDIAKDSATADECALWLLKQKQTNSWQTTKATADACYALLRSGTAKLSADAAVTIVLGGTEVKPEKIEAGTGFFEKKIAATEVKPELAAVKLVNADAGPAWGGIYWQYLEQMDKVTPHEGTPLKVTKTLFTKVHTDAGPELRPVTGKVKVGDELVVRLELRTDRDMEFVHLKDQRPSSVEPVNVLSSYKWQDGLAYYEATRDTASHFFFDVLPKGTHVFEYSARVQLRGACQTGLATLQCMYAPEFSSHSASAVLEVE